MTLTGTQTYIVGRKRVAIIDPGPAIQSHLHAITDTVGDGVVVCILLTHLHSDHAEGAAELKQRTGASISAGASGLRDGARIDTDDGELVALHTPGHTADHFSYWWPKRYTVFCGDLMMGGLDTALVAPPDGDLGDYLESLERLNRLEPKVIFPAHGPAFEDPAAAIQRYRKHRLDREAKVLAALESGAMNEEQLTQLVYGDSIDPALHPYARSAIEAYLGHLAQQGKVQRGEAGWGRVA